MTEPEEGQGKNPDQVPRDPAGRLPEEASQPKPDPPQPSPEPEDKNDGSHTRIGLKPLLQELWSIVLLIWEIIRDIFMKIIRIEDTTDVEGTIVNIKNGIKVKGYNIWLLVCSALLACIGLDQNSVAVIIGAMLISPLMSPILGIGLAVSTNDKETLRDASYNFGLAVGLSLLTAFIYFLLSPLAQETPEMTNRTKPTLLDVLVGFVGGVAGIVALSRKDKTNAIPGVAIATALMPPLCTAGFGLAKLNIGYFAGSFYLFFLNSVFISLATFLICRFLNFPLKVPYEKSLVRRLTRGIGIFVLILIFPSTIIFYNVIRQLNFEGDIEEFLEVTFDSKERQKVLSWEYVKKDSLSELKVTLAGDHIPEDSILFFNKALEEKYDIKNTRLTLIQTYLDPDEQDRKISQVKAEMLAFFQLQQEEQLAKQKKEEAQRKKVADLEAEIALLKGDTLPLRELRDELYAWNPELLSLKIGQLNASDFRPKPDSIANSNDSTLFTLIIQWQDSLAWTSRQQKETKIQNRIRKAMKLDTLLLLSFPLEPMVADGEGRRSKPTGRP